MQSDHRAVAAYWLGSAEADLRVCRDYCEELPPVACFHAQQSSEKALKAVLTFVSGDSPRTHVADALINDFEKLGEVMPPAVAAAARSLDKYYAPTRYPDALGGADPFKSYSASDAASTYQAAEIVIRWVRELLTT